MTEPVTLSTAGTIAILEINNPPVNALSQAVRQGLYDAIIQADADTEITAIVIIGAGRSFPAGADIKEFDQPMQDPQLPDVIDRIENCEKPVVAALHGTALGGGFEIALGSHYRIALPSAQVGLPEIHLGLLPGAGGTQRLPRLCGAAMALEIMLNGTAISAKEALNAGLIDRLVEGDLRQAAFIMLLNSKHRAAPKMPPLACQIKPPLMRPCTMPHRSPPAACAGNSRHSRLSTACEPAPPNLSPMGACSKAIAFLNASPQSNPKA